MTSKERIDRALRGEDVDRTPFTFWQHLHLENCPGECHAEATLAFHRRYRTDLVKVMSDYPFPHTGKVEANPFPEQIRALEVLHDALRDEAYFVETLFNPYNQARKILSKPEIRRWKQEKPQELLDLIEVIAKSEVNHVRRALAAGASGIFLAIESARPEVCTPEEYTRFGEPFDRMVLEAAAGAPLNILHLHGDHVYLDRFLQGWPAAINYPVHGTKVSIAEVRKNFDGLLLCGIDEVNFRTLSSADLKQQWHTARSEAGPKFILAPGCSVPDESTEEELSRLPGALRAVA